MEDVTGYYATQLATNGHTLTPEHIVLFIDAYVARDKAKRSRNTRTTFLYFNQTLWHHGSRQETGRAREHRLRRVVVIRLRAAGKPRRHRDGPREDPQYAQWRTSKRVSPTTS